MSTAQDSLVLGPQMAGALLTPEEFDAADDIDERFVYELITGLPSFPASSFPYRASSTGPML